MAEFETSSGLKRKVATLLVLGAASLLGACANRDSITVGSVPDDYRTNHPIMIAEKEFTLDLAVGAGDRGATKAQRETLDGFLANYDKSAAPVLNIMRPVGSRNEIAAQHAANGFASFAQRTGVNSSRVVITTYQAGSPEVSAPVRVSYINVAAQTNKCGRWPEDVLDTHENKHYANFGCAYQNNLAAQVANPNDLLGPRRSSEIDAAKRGNVIDDYRDTPSGWFPETSY